MVYAVTATAEREQARVRVEASGGTPGETLYLFRRDSAGVGVVRDTSQGTVVWGADGTVQVYDHEAQQGTETDYLLADGDGLQLASVRVSLPLWGTWLKSPGRPYRNTRCYFGSEGDVERAARRTIIDIEGTPRPVVLSEVRSGRGGVITLEVLTTEAAESIELLLDDGLTLMLDTPPQWAIPFRYISVGNSTSRRPLALDGALGLTHEAREFVLSDVIAVEAPLGVTVVDPGRTYGVLPTLFGSYVAMAATTSNYDPGLSTGVDL